MEEEEVESDKILVYGNVSEKTYAEQQKLLYLAGNYD